MRRTPQGDTPAELALRRTLHRRGFRYRVGKPIPGVTRSKPDLIFVTERLAVYVDGCFWHSCAVHASVPNENREWWVAKLEANVERDNRHREELETAGWTVLRFWEHDDPSAAADDVSQTLATLRYRGQPG
jgi:DNA mismatch endonuclease (patch repair protein)